MEQLLKEVIASKDAVIKSQAQLIEAYEKHISFLKECLDSRPPQNSYRNDI